MAVKDNQAVEFLPLDQIAPYPRNPRTHHEANVAKLVASIKEFGWTTPILIDEENAILAGHGRLLAARALLMPKVPCLRLEGLSSAQKRAYRLADNRLTLDSDWDLEMLQLELQELGEFDLALTGFDENELDDILGLNGPQEGEDDVPPLEKLAVSKLGEIWALGGHRLICADACNAAEVARLLSGVTPSVMVTDPPYGVDYRPEWRDNLAGGVIGKKAVKNRDYMETDKVADWSPALSLFSGSVAYVWHAPGALSIQVMEGIQRIGYEIRATLIWVKQQAVLGRGHYSYQHEPCCYAVRKGCTANWKGGSYESTVIRCNNLNPMGGGGDDVIDEKTSHGAQKPVELMRRPILNHTSSGQAVYDPFMGSGTAIIAAETTGRVAYGVEINPLYVDMAIRRWQTFTGKTATRLEDGKAFEG